MSLNSFNFLLFMSAVTVLYYIVPKKIQWFILLLASYTFYLFSGTKQVLFILFTTIVTYISGLKMQKIRDAFQEKIKGLGDEATKEEKQALKKEANNKIHKIQVATVLVHLAILSYVKYLNFFIENIDNLFTLFKWDASIPLVNVIVPLGLSYYTFNSIGYLIDIGRGKLEAEKHFGKFALWVSFFPSIVQGPLMRYGDVGTQLKAPHKFEYKNLKFGAQLMLWGFFKKIVIADRVAVISNAIFKAGFSGYTGSHIFLGVLAYSFQIYGDFSGGIDITRGAAQILGIDLPMNFERPFFATSMADFWRRWHMSLGAWMREFVFYPVMLSKPVTKLSKAARKKYGSYAAKMVPSVITPFVVFFLMNIWHGLGWQRVVNALYNATLISSSVALAPVYKKIIAKLKIDTETFSYRLFQMLRTFFLLCISRIITKAPSLSVAFKMIKAFLTDIDLAFLSGIDGRLFTYGVSQTEMLFVFMCIMVLLVVGILQERGVKIRETLAKQNIFFRWTLVLLLLFTVLIFGQYGPGYNASSFIYGKY